MRNGFETNATREIKNGREIAHFKFNIHFRRAAESSVLFHDSRLYNQSANFLHNLAR